MPDITKNTQISVCNMLGTPLYIVDGIDETSVSLVRRLNGQYDLTFSVACRPDETNVSYETLQEGMYLFVADVGYFKMRNPRETITADRMVKDVTAYSCDTEHDDKNLNIEINMGTKTSQEYLVTRQSNEKEVLVDPRTGIPYDWIVLHNTFPAQLAAFKEWLNDQFDFDNEAFVEVAVDDDEYEYISEMLDLIPRLKSKLMDYDENDEIPDLMDVVTYEEVVDGATSTVKYWMQSYASYNVDENKNIVSVTVNGTITDRIDELTTYYTAYGKQLSLLDIVCAKTGNNWSVGTVYGEADGDYTLANTHYQFEINETIYSFLTSTLAEKLKSVVNFDIKYKLINVTPVEHLGNDTGIVLSYNKLLNQLNLETDEDSLCTRLDVRGGNDITLEQVNFGEPYVVDIDYKLGVKNSAGERIYVPDALAGKYARYHQYREEYLRPAYVELTRAYNKFNDERTELIYLVPRDYMNNDWGTYSDSDLIQQITAYKNLLITLLQCYADDYGLPSGTNAYWATRPTQLPEWMCADTDVYMMIGNELYCPDQTHIQQTMYWWDYYAYHQTIVQIQIAQSAREATNEQTGYSYSTLTDEDLLARINAWETEWSLYGTSELGIKISSCETSMQTMVDAGSVIRKHMSYSDAAALTASDNQHYFSTNDESASDYLSEEKYYKICRILSSGKLWLSLDNTEKDLFFDEEWFDAMKSAGVAPYVTEYYVVTDVQDKSPHEEGWFEKTQSGDYVASTDATASQAKTYYLYRPIDIYTWEELTAAEKGFYGNVEANYYFAKYEELYNYRDEAQDRLDELNEQVDAYQEAMDAIQVVRDDLTAHVQLETYVCEQPDAIVIPEDADESIEDVLSDINTNYIGVFNTYTGLTSNESFTENEVKSLYLLYRDAEYTNENILTTSLNNTVDTVDILEELYQDALEQVSIVSRPQIHFTVDAENLLAIEEMRPFWDQFELGNYVFVEYKDGMLVKLRMTEYGCNPFIPSGGMTMQFSTMIRSKTKVTDVESVLGMAAGSGISSFGSGSSSGQGGEYGTNLNVAISDTMLGKLLGMSNGTTLGNALTSFMMSPSTSAVRHIADALRNDIENVVRMSTNAGFKFLTQQSAKFPVYEGLKEGDTVVNADCLQGGRVESLAKNSENIPVSWLDLDTGKFSFANGGLAYAPGDYIPVTYATNESPAAEGWWEKNQQGEYIESVDTSIVSGKTYYTQGTIGNLLLSGILHATGGDIGGVKIGAQTTVENAQNPINNGTLFIGNTGLFTFKFDSGSGHNRLGSGLLVSHLVSDGNGNNVSDGTLQFAIQKKSYTNGVQSKIDDAECSIRTFRMSQGEYASNGTTQTSDIFVGIDREYSEDVGQPAKFVFVARKITNMNTTPSMQRVMINPSDGSVTATGAISGASVSASGAVSGDSISATNGVSGDYANFSPTTARTTQGSVSARYFYGSGSNLTGMDYAEFFEWADGNALLEDRRGRFVTMDGDKIRLAGATDTYILGIVSGTPSVVGNTAHDVWHNKYLRDEFGAVITELVEHPAVTDENGNIVEEAYTAYEPMLNPEYDDTLEYIPREQRPEWGVIGLVGQLIMLDDGTCEVNGFATSANDGVATKSETQTNYRVMRRIDASHILVAAK